jgi:hypothetical protein
MAPGLAALALAAVPAVASAAPNLVPAIDTDPASTNPLAVHNWFVETTASPYSAHFFYGAAITNSGADPFELAAKPGSTTGDTAIAQQVVGGTATDLDPAKVAITSIGVPNPGFTAWGASNVFSIALTPSGGTAIPSTRNVFCWSSAAFASTCTTASVLADGVDMGIAPAEADSVPVGTDGAYFDITGATPGTGTVVETVNPTGVIAESSTTDNATPPLAVDIPGVTAQSAPVSTTAGKAGTATLKGTVVAPEVLGAAAGGTPAAATGAVTYVATNGAHGTVTVSGATATYTPAAGFTGKDSFTYYAQDSRGLRSAPATVAVDVAAATPTTPTTPTTPKPPTTPTPPKGPSGNAHFTLSAAQLLINQRIGQAAIRRLNAVAAKLDGRPAPTPPKAHKGGTVTLSAAQLLINQRIYQAAIRRAAILEARLDHKPAPHFGSGKGGTVRLTLGQLVVNQRIAQAAVRRANALVTRVGL